MQTLGQKLKMLREKSGKTQQEIAAILCLNRVTYTQYENDKRVPPLESLKKVVFQKSFSHCYIDDITKEPMIRFLTEPPKFELTDAQLADWSSFAKNMEFVSLLATLMAFCNTFLVYLFPTLPMKNHR